MRLSADRIFWGTIIVSLAAHIAFIAYGDVKVGLDDEERVRKIKVKLMKPPPPPPPKLPPPPPPPPPKEPPPPPPPPKHKRVKPKPPPPEPLPPEVDKVEAPKDMTAGPLTDAPVGEYAPEPGPQGPPAPIAPVVKVDKVKLTRQYLAKVRTELIERKKYPPMAQKMGMRGTVTISFTIQPDSTFTDIKVKRSSKFQVLDDAAVETVKSLSGTIKRPKEIGNTPLRTSVAVMYELG